MGKSCTGAAAEIGCQGAEIGEGCAAILQQDL